MGSVLQSDEDMMSKHYTVAPSTFEEYLFVIQQADPSILDIAFAFFT